MEKVNKLTGSHRDTSRTAASLIRGSFLFLHRHLVHQTDPFFYAHFEERGSEEGGSNKVRARAREVIEEKAVLPGLFRNASQRMIPAK